jgi:hypothetical protein
MNRRIVFLLIAAAVFGALAPVGKAQSVAAPQFSPSSAVSPSASGASRSMDLPAMRWRKLFGKTRCTTAVSAQACFDAWVMP